MKENNELTRDDIAIDHDMEVDCDEGREITVYIEAWFDVDKKFHIETASDDDTWLNMYGRYNPFDDSLRIECEISRQDGSTYFDYEPTKDEAQLIKDMIAKLETAAALYKRNNISAGKMSQSIAELNAKLVMLEQLRSKGYLAIEVYQSQTRDIQKQISSLKSERRSAFESTIQTMLDEVLKMRSLLNEIEEPLEEFNDKLFHELVKGIEINKQDEMTVTFLGGLKFTELI